MVTPGMFQALEFPPGPTHEICVETTKGGIQGGLVESPVVGDPARHMHVDVVDDLLEGHVTASMDAPSPDRRTDPSQCSTRSGSCPGAAPARSRPAGSRYPPG